jgi:predicted transcriptional regulator
MRVKYNKKRNTAFLYEALVTEISKSVIEENIERRDEIVSVIKEFFDSGEPLAKELQLYSAIYDTDRLPSKLAEKLLNEIRSEYLNLDLDEIFKSQTELINKVNKSFSPSVFNNYVPNYRNLASISQMFDKKTSVKHRVLLESQILNDMTKRQDSQDGLGDVTENYETVSEKFNEKYETVLTENQKTLLSKYVVSFADNGVELKAYINEEIYRLNSGIQSLLEADEVKGDPEMLEKTNKVSSILEGFNKNPFDKEMLPQLLKIQSLVEEFTN